MKKIRKIKNNLKWIHYKRRVEKAIKEERYEDAAKIRDEIKKAKKNRRSEFYELVLTK